MPARFGSFAAAPQRSGIRSIIRRATGIRRDPDEPGNHGLEPPGRLAVWVSIQVLVATAIIVVVLAGASLRPEIALPLAGLTPDDERALGLAFWLIFGLAGGLRAHARPGGSVMTFSLPFIVAGTILGGPVAGALMGLVSELEVRELRSLPWYGTLANHAVSIVAAVAAALAGDLVGRSLASLMPAQEPVRFFLVAMATATTFALVNVALVIPTLALKGKVSLAEASRSYDASFRATSFAEGILAWLMAVTYIMVGWWAPVICVALVLIIWQAHDRSEAMRHDAKTGLLNDSGFEPRLAAAVEQARAGRRAAAFVLLDLDRFKAVNDVHLYEAGDEVLRVTAQRLLATVRIADSVARMNRAGDEFAVLLDDVKDVAVAVRLAERLQARIHEPIHLRSRDAVVDVGASMGVVHLDLGTTLTPAAIVKLADVRMLRGKTLGSGIVATGDDDETAHADRVARKPTRA